MVKVEHLVKRYGQNYALNDVSFEIGEGEIVGLLGPNGAGKSTTMNILTGYLSATSGNASIDGIDIVEYPIEAKSMIGFLPEQPPLYQDMTVDEYLNFVYELKGCTLDRAAHLAEIISVVRLSDVRTRLIKNLSKGYKQRVGIAQALVGDPKLIVFDEPTVGLDPKQILEIRNLIRTLSKNHTVILSTHILAEVQAVCERVIIINQGKIIADEKTADLTRAIEDSYHYEIRISGPQKDVISGIEKVRGVKTVSATGAKDGDAYCYVIESEKGIDVRKPVFNLCAERSWPIVGLAPVGTDLESIFIRLVDRDNGVPETKRDSRRRKAH
ncbi:MAG: ATP-binding cassette domain-containing protein [Ruminococcaceae bacterium]|nr:ATP-binding cassette domain-containing protein [Oscillospiraceae bacterium]